MTMKHVVLEIIDQFKATDYGYWPGVVKFVIIRNFQAENYEFVSFPEIRPSWGTMHRLLTKSPGPPPASGASTSPAPAGRPPPPPVADDSSSTSKDLKFFFNPSPSVKT